MQVCMCNQLFLGSCNIDKSKFPSSWSKTFLEHLFVMNALVCETESAWDLNEHILELNIRLFLVVLEGWTRFITLDWILCKTGLICASWFHCCIYRKNSVEKYGPPRGKKAIVVEEIFPLGIKKSKILFFLRWYILIHWLVQYLLCCWTLSCVKVTTLTSAQTICLPIHNKQFSQNHFTSIFIIALLQVLHQRRVSYN